MDRLGTDGDPEKVGVDPAGAGPVQFVIVGQLHIRADQCVGGSEADSVVHREALENLWSMLFGVSRKEGKNGTIPPLGLAKGLVGG